LSQSWQGNNQRGGAPPDFGMDLVRP